VDRAGWLAALGGSDNVRRIETVAGTRLRIALAVAGRIDAQALRALGAAGLVRLDAGLVHVVIVGQGGGAAAVSEALRGGEPGVP
jgi:PTS system N-acetylglucosamine-specific IIC component